jgi:polyisoprenyl-teichoic acid--peptidoglycan teichoic acid transferase
MPSNRRFILAALVMLLIIGTSLIFTTVRGAVQGFGAVAIDPRLTPISPAAPTAFPEWTATGRVNILLLGIDERESEPGPWRTDTMILLSIDPAAQTAAVLSIPRDLWVTIPGYDLEARINTAHFYGDLRGYPGGGPALAMATVQAVFDLPIQYYIRFNFAGFEKLIDAIGGIDLNVEAPIDDPLYPDSGYGYAPLHIDAGLQHMDGQLALKYARTRHGGLEDFDRMHRQQQVIMAVRDKVTRANMAPTLMTQIVPLLQAMGSTLKTNFTPDQLVRLIQLGVQLDPRQIQALAIEPSMTLPYHVAGNPPQDVLIPIRDQVRRVRDQLLNSTPDQPATQRPVSPQLIQTPTPSSVSPSSATLQPVTTRSSQPTMYVVQPGNTLYSLARQFGTTVEALMAANGLTSVDIRIGQTLIIPLP